MNLYTVFANGKTYFRSPIFSIFRKLARAINPQNEEDGFIWNNLFKVDEAKDESKNDIKLSICNAFPVLKLEIELLKPDVVVFFTYHENDIWIESLLGTLIKKPVKNFNVNTLCLFKNDLLPYLCFRTYHPNYLRMKHLEDKIIETVASMTR